MPSPSLSLPRPSRLLPIVFTFFSPALGVSHFHLSRSIGPPNDPVIQGIVTECAGNGTDADPMDFDGASCSNMINCVLGGLPAGYSAGMQSGGNIASLVPTILALVGAGPLDLVQLAFMSPHRAIATCIFGIGLPSGLFRQLDNQSYPQLGDRKAEDTRVREWRVPIRHTRYAGWLSQAKTALIDFFTLLLAAVMFWRNTVIGAETIVTWRCSYSFLLILWPVICLSWLIIALALLHIFAKNITITYSGDSPGIARTRWDLLKLPYSAPAPLSSTGAPLPVKDLTPAPSKSPSVEDIEPVKAADMSSIPAPNCAASYLLNNPDSYLAVRITMRHEQHWGWFESIIEAGAVGIYLYATFVLTSLLFLKAEDAIHYAAIMLLSMSAIRIMGML